MYKLSYKKKNKTIKIVDNNQNIYKTKYLDEDITLALEKGDYSITPNNDSVKLIINNTVFIIPQFNKNWYKLIERIDKLESKIDDLKTKVHTFSVENKNLSNQINTLKSQNPINHIDTPTYQKTRKAYGEATAIYNSSLYY
jgi:hypothetical protein